MRLLYLFYYLKNLDKKKFFIYLKYIREKKSISLSRLVFDIIYSSLKYNISILEYFQFRFYDLNKSERATFAGTGYMYEYQLVMNPKSKRIILDDKRHFYKKYKNFVLHQNASLEELQSNPSLEKNFINNKSGKIVFKVANGKCGAQVIVKSCSEFTNNSIINFMKKNGYDLVEEYIIQHPVMSSLSPSAVNTVRIITQLDKNDNVIILGCRLRISVGKYVDNMAAGNIAAPIDEKTGIVNGPGVYSDITKPPVYKHPITGVKIIGFKIPYWKETISLAIKAAKAYPENRSIGWDIVITEKGPGLIEGNHDWCKLVWQLPVNKGMKPILDKYLSEYVNNSLKV